MPTRVAFLRAVNLGRRTVQMARLRDVMQGLGFGAISTFLNSGNVSFEAAGRRDALEGRIERALEKQFGFEITTFVRTASEVTSAVHAKPFRVSPSDTYFVTFLKHAPTAAQRRSLEALSNDFDNLVVKGRDVHWRMHGKSTDTRLKTKDWESIVGRHHSTSRNMRMLRTLAGRLGRP